MAANLAAVSGAVDCCVVNSWCLISWSGRLPFIVGVVVQRVAKDERGRPAARRATQLVPTRELREWKELQLAKPKDYSSARSSCASTGSKIAASSFSGLFTRVLIGHIFMAAAGYGKSSPRGSGSSVDSQ